MPVASDRHIGDPGMGSDPGNNRGGGTSADCWWPRGRNRRAAALRGRFAAADPDRGAVVRPRLPRRERAEMLVDPLSSSYPTPEKLQHFSTRSSGGQTVPGVQDAAWSSAAAAGECCMALRADYEIRRRSAGAENQRPTTSYQVVSRRIFRARPADCGVRALTAAIPRQPASASSTKHSCAPSADAIRSACRCRSRCRQTAGQRRTSRDRRRAKPVRAGRTSEDFVQITCAGARSADDLILMVRSRTGRADALAPAVRGAISRIDRSSWSASATS